MLKDREALPQDFERHMRGGDIREALPDRWLRTWLKRRPAGVDLLVAGPPCQGFSCAGRACPDDERNLLVHEAIRVIGVVQPRIAILENVPGMLERHADLIREIGLGLSRRGKNRPGYYVYAELVHGEPLGVPQTRRRLLLVGVRRDLVHPSACERLPRLLFPVACPHSRPTDGRLLGAAVPAGSSLTAKEILSDLAGTPPPYGTGKSWTQPYRRNGRRGPSGFLREVRALQSQYLDGGIMGSADEATLEEYFNHEASSHLPDVARKLQLLRTAATSSSRSTKSIGVAAGGFDASSASSFPNSSPRKHRNACFSRTSGRCSRSRHFPTISSTTLRIGFPRFERLLVSRPSPTGSSSRVSERRGRSGGVLESTSRSIRKSRTRFLHGLPTRWQHGFGSSCSSWRRTLLAASSLTVGSTRPPM